MMPQVVSTKVVVPLPARVRSIAEFEEKSAAIGYLQMPPSAAPMMYYRGYGACLVDQHESAGLLVGFRDKCAMPQHTEAATGVPIYRHVLLNLTACHPCSEIIFSKGSTSFAQIKCFCRVDSGGWISYPSNEQSPTLVAGHNLLHFPYGVSFRRARLEQNAQSSDLHTLAAEQNLVIITQPDRRDYVILESLGTMSLTPIPTLVL